MGRGEKGDVHRFWVRKMAPWSEPLRAEKREVREEKNWREGGLVKAGWVGLGWGGVPCLGIVTPWLRWDGCCWFAGSRVW